MNGILIGSPRPRRPRGPWGPGHPARAQLASAGCVGVVTERVSSGRKVRPGLTRLLKQLEAADTLAICKLDRLARSLQELLAIAADLEARCINLQVLDQAIDSTTPTGRLLFQLLGTGGEFERQPAIERTRAARG
ncbi:MAG: recombinase family protein [Cyanobacteriota bacterium]|nr:recombinase family protein [Cyanobacteriota bacterium]